MTTSGRNAFAAVLLAGLVGGCDDIPRDSFGALERICESGELRVGIAENPPWTIADGDRPSGIEAYIVQRFAGDLGASVRYIEGSETVLIDQLHERRLDIVIAGLKTDTPHRHRAALTKPYLQRPHGNRGARVLAVSQGESRLLFTLDQFVLSHRSEWSERFADATNE